ncbi:MAG: hypothetical protein N2049_05110 [Anaerolineales bacterium]|nr:hypothetical protein [Anaerolineales bacterium]
MVALYRYSKEYTEKELAEEVCDKTTAIQTLLDCLDLVSQRLDLSDEPPAEASFELATEDFDVHFQVASRDYVFVSLILRNKAAVEPNWLKRLFTSSAVNACLTLQQAIGMIDAVFSDSPLEVFKQMQKLSREDNCSKGV